VNAVVAAVVTTVVVIVVAVVVSGVPVVAVAPIVVAVVTGECQRARHQQASGTYREDDSSLLEHGISP
jgi:MFS superfamily sulfate permease-like transporter